MDSNSPIAKIRIPQPEHPSQSIPVGALQPERPGCHWCGKLVEIGWIQATSERTMAIARLVFCLVLASGLGLLAFQNQQPLVLTFLGAKTMALPLSLWLILALFLGAATTVVLSWLLAFYAGSSPQQSAPRTVRRSSLRGSRSWKKLKFPRWDWLQPAPSSAEEGAAWDDDDWGEEPDRSRASRRQAWDPDMDIAQPPVDHPRPANPVPRPRQADSVVDAEFRVIVPPSRNLDDES
ncbi:MAG: LapA family protein [Synechococcales bacterium]|nr:LapA family protein [Synechococcales bacterium]